MNNIPSHLARRRLLQLGALGLAVSATGIAHAWSNGPVGSGNRTEQVRTIAGVDAVRLRGSFKVRVRQGSREAVTVRVDDNLQALLETNVGADRTLEIQWKRGESPRPSTEPEVLVEVLSLKAVSVQGSGDVFVEPLQTVALAGSIAGSGDLVIDGLKAEALNLSIAGSGDVRASGRATRLTVSVSGSGDIDADALAADNVSVRIAGSGDARVQAAKTLEVSIAGSGDVRWRGDGQLTKSSVAGSGSVARKS